MPVKGPIKRAAFGYYYWDKRILGGKLCLNIFPKGENRWFIPPLLIYMHWKNKLKWVNIDAFIKTKFTVKMGKTEN